MKKFLSLIAMSLIVLCLGMVTFASPRMAPCAGKGDGTLCDTYITEKWIVDGYYDVYVRALVCEHCTDTEIILDVITSVGNHHNWLSNGFCSECGATFN